MILWVVIVLLTSIIVFLSITLFIVVKKASYLSRKQKEFIVFAIDMYIDYAEELEITSPEQHEVIIENLKEIKEKHVNGS